jgi:hypothetical protein
VARQRSARRLGRRHSHDARRRFTATATATGHDQQVGYLAAQHDVVEKPGSALAHPRRFAVPDERLTATM